MKTHRQVHGRRPARGRAPRRGPPRHATTRPAARPRPSRSTLATCRWSHPPTPRSSRTISTTTAGAAHERHITFLNTTYTDRPPRRSGLRRTLRRRALPTRCTTVDRLAATDDKKVKALTLGSDLGDTILTQLRPRHRLAYPTFLITILSFPPTPTATTDPRLTVSADARALSHDLTELQVLHPV
jgi:hypothetical protein